LQQINHTLSDYLRRTDVLAEFLGLKLSDLPGVLACSKAMIFAYRSGKNPISNKAWLRLLAAEKQAGLSQPDQIHPALAPPPPPSASSSASSAPLHFDLSNNDPLEIRELSGVLERIAIALEKLVEFEENKHI
jgi:hypothetical protein